MAGRRSLSRRSFLHMTMLGLGASLIPATSAKAVVIDHPTAGTCITSAELQLAQLINNYRAEHGRPAIPLSKSLTTVAQLHVIDLMQSPPDSSQGCNMHSWSPNGPWQSVCYPQDQNSAVHMWNKPKEITNGVYDAPGYEIAYGIFGANVAVDPAGALQKWKDSAGHNSVMLNQQPWDDIAWLAMGVGICGNYATVWFGEMHDPLGTIGGCSVVNQPYRTFLPTVRH